MEEETTFQIDEEQVEQGLEQSEVEGDLLDFLDQIYDQLKTLEVRYQVYQIKFQEILTNG